ncbi:MAG: hypothetical protein RH860_10250 [Cytophagales bacterium]
MLIIIYGNTILKNFIIKTVEIRSEGLYKVELEEINVNFLKLGFEVNHFHLIPDRTIYRAKKAKGEVKTGLYDIQVPHFEVNGLRLLTAFYENSFIINSLIIEKPDLRLLDVPIFRSNKDYSEEYDDIRPIIIELVEYFLVRDLYINEGVFDIFLEKEGQVENFTASKISLRLKNFQIDKRNPEGQEKFLYSDGAELVFKDYKLVLKDGIHVINANEIGINTLDSIVYARGFSLNPSQISLKELRESRKSYFTTFFPEILLSGADIIKAYEKDTFNIQKLLVLRPKIGYFNQTPLSERVKSEKTLKNQVNFFPLIDGYLNEVNIGKFDLEKGNFRYGEPLENVPENVNISGIDVFLDEFHIDSTAYRNMERILYSKNMELDFSSFKMSLRDSVHVLRANSLYISSKEKILKANGLQIKPLKNFDKGIKKDQLNILLPNIELRGLDLYKMYLEGNLLANEFIVDNPVVNIEIKKKGKSKKNKNDRKSANDVYNLFSRYLRSSSINQININNGSIDFDQTVEGKNEEIIADNISLVLYNFFLDSISFVSENNFLFSENIDFELKDYDFLLPNEINEIKVGLFQFSSKKRELNLRDISMKALRKDTIRQRLKRQGKSGYLEFEIPIVKFENADILRVLKNRQIVVDKILINKPQLYSYRLEELPKDTTLPPDLENIKNSIQSLLPFIKVKKLELSNGEISSFSINGDSSVLSYNNKLHLTLKGFNFLPDSILVSNDELFFSRSIKAVIHDQKIFINKGIYQITSDSMVYSFPEKQLKIIGFNLESVKKEGIEFTESVELSFQSPMAIFNDVNLEEVYDNQILNVDSAEFDTLRIVIQQRNSEINKDSIKKSNFNMPRILKELNVSSINIGHGEIDYLDYKKSKIAEAVFNGQIIKTELANHTIGSQPESLPFEGFRLVIPKFRFEAKKINHTLLIDSVNFDLATNTISSKKVNFYIDSIYLDSIRLKMGAFSNATIDSLYINGIDFNNFYVNRNAKIDTFLFWNPELEIHDYSNTTSKPSLKKIQFYTFLKDYIKELQADEILIYNGKLKNFKHENDTNKLRSVLNNIYIDFSDFLVDSLSSTRDRFLFSEDVVFRLKNYSRILPDEMNMIIFDEIGFSTGNEKIYAKGTHLKPLYNDYDYSRKLGYQGDRVEAKIKTIDIHGVDLEKLYLNNELRAGELFMDSLYIDDFRDKRVELNENFRPPMIHEVIRNIPFSFSIDSIHLLRGNAKYREFAADGEYPGEIFFNDINSKIYLVSNDSNYYRYNPNTYLFAIGKLMDQGDIIMSGNFNFMDTNNTFSIRGSLGSMDMTAVNSMTENVAFVSIKSGISRSLNFNFEADEDYAEGDLNFQYSKFKIFVINKKTGEAEGLDEGIVSWFANTFLINSKNPHLGFFKDGEIFFRRDKGKSIVNYVWKAIYSGIKTSIGAQTQKKLHKIAEKEEKASKKK